MSSGFMSNLSAGEVEAGAGGSLVQGPSDIVFADVSIDTRTLRQGDLFFAIRGIKQDGHKFVPDALAKGALGAVVEHGYEYPGEFPPGRVLIKVADTHQALKVLAGHVRRRWHGTLVALTGSMGKTTTKEFAAQVLQTQFSVYRTPGNYNNLFGLPLALFGLHPGHEIGIFEMGMSAPGELAEMCRIAAPSVGMITNVAPVHLEFFNSLEDIAEAKGELVRSLPQDGTLVYNVDDPLVRGIADRFGGRKISFGLSSRAIVRADDIKIVSLDGTRFRLSFAGEIHRASVPFAGAHCVMNALASVALGCRFDVSPDKMIQALRNLQQASMRGQIVRFKEGFTVIDDSYNSNPRALMQMIQVLAQAPSFKRRILVAGEMLELGSSADSLHAECGAFAVDKKIELLIGVQGSAREMIRAAIASGASEAQARFFENPESAADFIVGEVRSGDLVLVKGSRGVRTEKIVKKLCSGFERIAG
jgi:UDP-N-acetylmuramoyl-tripeptide--D-alanyl-D-alanine ligase